MKPYTLLLLPLFIMCSCQPLRHVQVFFIGDSTMADRMDTTITPERGWGQVAPTVFNDYATVRNHAKSGRSTKSFLAEGRWEDAKAQMHAGDIVLIQFGHNDSKSTDSTRFATIPQYEANLHLMVQEAKALGAQPIILTPIARRHFDQFGDLKYVHGGYPTAAMRVAESENIPLIDMTRLTMDWLQAEGDSATVQYFCHMLPGQYSKYPDGKIDDTHLREAGAVKVALIFAQAVLNQHLTILEPYIILNKELQYTEPCNIK